MEKTLHKKQNGDSSKMREGGGTNPNTSQWWVVTQALQCLVTTDLEIRTSRNTGSGIYLGVPKGCAVPSPLVVVPVV